MSDHREDKLVRASALIRVGDVSEAPEAVERLQAVVHELAGVLDGSLRLLDMARASMTRDDAPAQQSRDALRHIDAARAAMAHVAGMIHEAYRPGRWRLGKGSSQSVASAVGHAVDVMSEAGAAQGVQVVGVVGEGLEGVAAASVYTVLVNGIRNAIEALSGAGVGGVVEVRAALEGGADGGADGGGGFVVIEILDDGPGVARGSEGAVFARGFTTKAGSSGIGLSLVRDVARELGGEVSLEARWDGRDERRGAALRLRYPAAGLRMDGGRS